MVEKSTQPAQAKARQEEPPPRRDTEAGSAITAGGPPPWREPEAGSAIAAGGPPPWRDTEAGSAKKPRPPRRILKAHEVNPYDHLDWDWTLDANRGKELALRELRNDMIKRQLERGETAAYRSSGWSCYPYISSDDRCYFTPVSKQIMEAREYLYNTLIYWDDHMKAWHELKIGDIVFCAVEPGRRFFAHPIKKIEWEFYRGSAIKEPCYTIANLEGRENGYCWKDTIWGVLYRVNDEPFHGVTFH